MDSIFDRWPACPCGAATRQASLVDSSLLGRHLTFLSLRCGFLQESAGSDVLSQSIKRLVGKFNAKFFANKALQLAGKSEIHIRSLVTGSCTPDALFHRMKKARICLVLLCVVCAALLGVVAAVAFLIVGMILLQVPRC